jgi:hypothetical protein
MRAPCFFDDYNRNQPPRAAVEKCMGSNILDLSGLFGVISLGVAVYFLAGLRTALPSRGDLFESIAWGKFFVALVYACMSFLFFWVAFARR